MSEVALTRREQQALRKAALEAAPVRTLRDIGSALEPSTIPNVMKLKSNIVCVFASEWELYKQEIEEQCCVKCIVSRPNRHSSAVDITKKRHVLFSQVYSCHRGGSYEPESREKHPIQCKSKKVGCEATLTITCYADKSHVYVFDFIVNHTNHIPENIKTDLGLIPLTRASPGSPARKIRLEILCNIDQQEYSLNGYKINYFDIYNKILAINQTIFCLHEDDFKSMKMWFTKKLSPKGFIIFEAAAAFCMDATYSITQRLDDILYTIVICDEELDRGFPCAYMLTNDHSLGPIVQWLKHLKDNQLIVNPWQFTIDCSDAETNVLMAIFPGCQIQYCLFHVSQACKVNLILSDTLRPIGVPWLKFYFKEESIRINMRSGPMTAAQRQKRKIEMSAEAVPAYMHANMIVSPSKAMSLNATLDDTDDILEDGFWFINSFTKDSITYQVEVNNNVILSCTCYSWARYMKPCKHMHLLRIHMSGFAFLSVAPANNVLPITIFGEQFVNDNTMLIDGTRESTGRRHNEQDLYQLMQYATEEEAEVIRAAYAAPIKTFQEIKAKYEAHFRTLNTQRH
ncbi:hypothetical protein PHYBLDRAFT_148157 [Phycomyces blakesleeanus NRRL 1555(-)]|uniref:SWIM-type domain-containing protein n=1 Tax=Phycomyces blakesleeanus (strain ATCC 8743b / DSM 1359 / FGSC 10004 / NBRC 33097 / NRRL 1555) TaxID=763407 RepID=A0A167LRE6_PHYB8|nr:hypothetical protein PHYBLDRAFT_148157 [Phycomyces blakesleeanus NRRL 1555(-)]OAD70939.1 hypothetical protein PHYBLDRAFT_148157 [Phycomyces blakesleeanus NRRL 1555(-)]|eukprot:XP_018288979.1 hypothetical protein PHYBLDRAFT_148157 [Phycomyces blakesleeanus NRRL 1555(-)]